LEVNALVLAAFVTPGLAVAGAAAMAAPILIHLLARRRFKRIRWAAMDFLIDAERRNRRRIRMEEWILLALRCLAVLFVGFLVSRPFVSATDLASMWGGSRRVERVFVLDDSFSMGYESADGTHFARAKIAVRRLLDSIRKETPDDTATILRMSAPATPSESGVFLNDVQTEELLARLEGVTPSQRSIDLPAVFEGVVDVLERDPGIVNAAIYVISDFQRGGWVDRERASSDAAATPTVAAPLSAWAAADRGLRLILVNVGDPQAANTALTDLQLPEGQVVAGTTGTVRVDVANLAPRPAEGVELQVTVGDRPQESKTIRSLGERQTTTVEMEAEFVRAGDEAVRVEAPRDRLPVDNVRYASAHVVSAVRLLIINGEPSSDAYDDEAALLVTALRPEGEVFSGHEVVVVDESGLDDVKLADFHAVILANVYRPSEPAIAALENFVRQGGGVIFFLGDQVDADLYNAALYRAGEGVLPAELGVRVRPADAAHLVVTDRLHPAMRGVGRQDDPLGIGQIPFMQYLACQPFGIEKEDFDAPAAAASSRPANVIARFDDAEEHPAIIERPFGQGRVVLMTSSVDKEWNQWPDHPTFLPVVTELVRHVVRSGEGHATHTVGAALELPIDPAAFNPDVIVRTPAYPDEPEANVVATASEEGQGLTVRWEHTGAAGLYQFALRRPDGGETLRLVAVNVDSRESDLTMAQENEIRRALGTLPFEYIQGLDKLSAGADQARTELWRLFLIAAVAVLMTEQTLAWWWGRRR